MTARGLNDSRLMAEVESLLGKRPDKKNRAVRWSELEAIRKSLINAGGSGTLDGIAPEGEDLPAVPGTLGERLAARLKLAEKEIDAAELEAQAAGEKAQNALSALKNAGTVFRAANVVTLPDGSKTAGVEAYVWDDEGNGTGSAMLLHGEQVIAPGTLSANQLVAGFGNNLLQNSRFYDGLLHWLKGGNLETVGDVRAAGSTYAHPSYRTLMLYQNGTTTAESFFEYSVQQDGTTDRIPGAPCKPGEWYGASAYLSATNCQGRVEIRFYDTDGIQIIDAARVSAWVDTQGSINNPDLWPRVFAKAQAPAGAAYVTVRIRKNGTNAGAASSFLFIWKPMGEETHEKALEPAPYASGEISLMTGDMIYSRSLTGRHLTVNEAVITGKAQMGDAVVTTLSIDGYAVTVPTFASRDTRVTLTETWANLVSVSMERQASPTLLMATWQIDGEYKPAIADMNVVRDGDIAVGTWHPSVSGWGVDGGTQTTGALIVMDDNLGSGPTTYTLRAKKHTTLPGDYAAGTPRIVLCTLTALHAKR